MERTGKKIVLKNLRIFSENDTPDSDFYFRGIRNLVFGGIYPFFMKYSCRYL